MITQKKFYIRILYIKDKLINKLITNHLQNVYLYQFYR